MEQLSLCFDVVDERTVLDAIIHMAADAGFRTDEIFMKPLKTSGETSLIVIEKQICKVIIKKRSKRLHLRKGLFNNIEEAGLPYKKVNTESGYSFLVPFETTDDLYNMRSVLMAALKMAYLENAGHTYGCCSRFVECSDARKCTHPDHLFALGCMYRDNLEAGRIFYGKNPTA